MPFRKLSFRKHNRSLGRSFTGEGKEFAWTILIRGDFNEKDIEIIPKEKIVTVFLSDTMGLTKLLPDYVVESTLKKINDSTTQVEISNYYSTSTWKVWILNFIIKRKIAGETTNTLKAMKKR